MSETERARACSCHTCDYVVNSRNARETLKFVVTPLGRSLQRRSSRSLYSWRGERASGSGTGGAARRGGGPGGKGDRRRWCACYGCETERRARKKQTEPTRRRKTAGAASLGESKMGPPTSLTSDCVRSAERFVTRTRPLVGADIDCSEARARA